MYVLVEQRALSGWKILKFILLHADCSTYFIFDIFDILSMSKQMILIDDMQFIVKASLMKVTTVDASPERMSINSEICF